LGDELALGLVGGESGDGFQLAALLLHRGSHTLLAVGQRPLPSDEGALFVRRLGEPTIELIQLAGQLLFLAEDPLLDLLELPLAAPRLLFERGARLQRRLARLQLGALADAIRLALSLRDDLLRGDGGIAEPAIGEPLVQQDTDEEREQADERVEPGQRFHHPSSRARPFIVIEVRVRFDEYRRRARGESNTQKENPRLCRVPWCFEPGMTRWASSMESFRLPLP